MILERRVLPIHDWSRVDGGLFHYFHQGWTTELSYSLNAGRLPPDYLALAEQSAAGRVPDVLTLERNGEVAANYESGVDVAVEIAPPQAHYVTTAEMEAYAALANRIVISHRLGRIV